MTRKKKQPPRQEPPREDTAPPAEKQDDLFVPLGNLEGKTIAHLREVLEQGSSTVLQNYEEMVEDFIQSFNHAVTQGVPPEWVLFAFTQAYAITLGQCLRAGLSFEEAKQFLRTILDNASLSKDLVKQVTIITSGTKQ